MPNNENLSNFIDPKAWSDFERLEKVIASAADSMEFLALAAQDAFKGLNNAATLQQLVDLMNKANTAGTGLGDTTKKLKGGLKELNEEQLRANMGIKERNDLLKQQVAAELAPAGSIAKVRAEAALLRSELMRLNQETQVGRANEIKNQLLVKDAYIKNNVDAYTAQKINIGNYPEAMGQVMKMKEEMNALASSGQKSSVEFENLSTAFTSTTSAMGGLKGMTTWCVGEMEKLALAGKADSEEFERLAVMAAELKAEMAGVGMAIKEASEKAEAGALRMEKLVETMKEIGKFALMFFGVQAGMEFIAGISEEFEKADKAGRMLKNTLENIGASNMFKKLTAESEEFAEKFKYLDTYEVQNVFSKLITYGKLTEEQIKESMPVIIDLAAKTGHSIEESASVIIKAMEGSSKGLKEFGINIKDAKDAQGNALPQAERYGFIMEQLKHRINGAAEAFGNSWSGQVEAIKKDFREAELTIANFFVSIAGIEKRELEAGAAAKKEAEAGSALLSEYKEISKQVNQTSDDKKKLSDITHTLTGMFGSSITEIDKETDSLKLNIKATQDLIDKKSLLANTQVNNLVQEVKLNEERMNFAKEEADKSKMLFADEQKRSGLSFSKNVTDAQGRYNASPEQTIINQLYREMIDTKNKSELADIAKKESYDKLVEFIGGDKKKADDLLSKPDTYDPKSGIPPPPGGDKPDKDNAIALEKEHSTLLYEEYKLRAEADAQTQKNIYENEHNSYEMRLEALKEYNAKMNQIKLNQITVEQGNQKFTIDNMYQKPKESDADYAARQANEKEKANILDLKFAAQKRANIIENDATIIKLDEDFTKERFKILEKYREANATLEASEMAGEKTKYEKGLETKDQYLKAVAAIKEKYALSNLVMEKAWLEQLVSEFKTLGINTDDIEKKLQDVINKINNLPSTKKSAETKKDQNFNEMAVSMANKALGLGMDADQEKQAAGEIVSAEKMVQDAVKQRYDAEMSALEAKKALIDQNYDAEINNIQGSFQSEQKKAAAIKILNAEKMAADKVMHDQEVKLKQKMAIQDKVANVSKAIGNEAVAVNAMLTAGPLGGIGFILAAIAATIGAANVALAMNAPLPQYGTGTEDHPGGDAIVGELNKPEYIYEPGKPVKMVNRATRMSLAKHTRVVTEDQLIRDSQAGLEGSLLNHVSISMGVEQVIQREMQGLRSEVSTLNETVKNKRENHFHWDNGQLRKTVKNGNSWTTYLDSNFN